MTDSYETPESDLIRRYIVIGSRRLSNYWWALVIFLGGLGFLLTGISSYLGEDNTVVRWLNLLPFIQSKNIIFFHKV